MNFKGIEEVITFSICLFILLGSIILTFKTRFIQFRMIPEMFRLLFKAIFKKKKDVKGEESIAAHKALFTAMSTSIGLGNIVSPVIAVQLGGPGAIVGYILATIFGNASMFTEVTFAMKYRKKNEDGTISGGPMQYLKKVLSPYIALLYSLAGLITLVIWSSNQSNALAVLLEPRYVPRYISGLFLAISVTYILTKGIKKIGDISAKLVPVMFLLYTAATSWIIFKNSAKLPEVFDLIFRTAFTPKALAGAGVGYGILTALRWGLAKGFFANESGLGVATIPHSMSQTKKALDQGILSMISVYSNGLLSILSGLVVLVTGTWTDASLGLGVNVIAQSFSIYFPRTGIIILMISAFLFAFGTILGNSYIGGQCFLYTTKNRWLAYYNILIAIVVFLGAISDVKFLATITDFCLIPLAIPNVIGIIILAFKKPNLLKPSAKQEIPDDKI